MKFLCSVAVFWLCTACTCKPILVPTPIPCPAPATIERPFLPISSLKPDSPASDVVKAYVISVEVLKGYAVQLEMILQGYRK